MNSKKIIIPSIVAVIPALIVVMITVLNFSSQGFKVFFDKYWAFILVPLAVFSLFLVISQLVVNQEYKAKFKRNIWWNIVLFGGAILFGIIFTLVKVLSVKG